MSLPSTHPTRTGVHPTSLVSPLPPTAPPQNIVDSSITPSTEYAWEHPIETNSNIRVILSLHLCKYVRTAIMSQLNYRTINIDALDPESSTNFPMESLLPANLPQAASSGDAANAATQVRQMLRGGDPEGALRSVLDTAPLGGDDRAKEVHLATVIDVLQGIRQGEMTRILEGVCSGDGGAERADCLMKYLYVEHHLGCYKVNPGWHNGFKSTGI